MMFANYSLDEITYSFIASFMWGVSQIMTQYDTRGVQRRPKKYDIINQQPLMERVFLATMSNSRSDNVTLAVV